MNTTVEINVKSGRVGDIMFIEVLDNGELEIFPLVDEGRGMTKYNSRKERTFEFTGIIDGKSEKHYIIARFVLINGYDKSRKLEMIVYEIDESSKGIKTKWMTLTELALINNNNAYKEALITYQYIVDKLKESGQL